MSDFVKADEHYTMCLNRIDRIEGEIEELEKENKTHLITYSNLKSELADAKTRLEELKKLEMVKKKQFYIIKNLLNYLIQWKMLFNKNVLFVWTKLKKKI